MTGSGVHIFRRGDPQPLIAVSRDDMKSANLAAIESAWGPHRTTLRQELTDRGIERRRWPQSLHWDSTHKGPDLELLESKCFAIEYENAIQGVMLKMMENMNDKAFPNPEWLRRMADAEDRCSSVAVGGLAQDTGLLQGTTVESPKIFGRLIEYARRERGLTLEALARVASVDLAELVAIETEPDAVPMPGTVFQLAQVLGLPALTLTELAGLTHPRKILSEAAVRFAARSEPTTRLSANEKQAFEEFVKVIVETPIAG